MNVFPPIALEQQWVGTGAGTTDRGIGLDRVENLTNKVVANSFFSPTFLLLPSLVLPLASPCLSSPPLPAPDAASCPPCILLPHQASLSPTPPVDPQPTWAMLLAFISLGATQ